MTQPTKNNRAIMIDDLSVLPTIDEINQEIARRASLHFATFVKYVAPWYKFTQFHLQLAQTIDRFARGEIPRLLIEAPPRHGKSALVSVFLPAYLFVLDRDAEILSATYGATLAKRMSRDTRRIVQSDQYQLMCPSVKIGNVAGEIDDRRADTIEYWELSNCKGKYQCAGMSGAFTGTGGNWFIVDDPIKNREEADSEVFRERAWSLYSSAVLTRLQPDRNGHQGVLITLTRWHEDDLAGRILDQAEKNPDSPQWEHIKLPAVAELPIDPSDWRIPGEALWPDRFSITRLNEIRNEIDERDWRSLYQCDPVPARGTIFSACDAVYWYDSVRDSRIPNSIMAVGYDMTPTECKQIALPSRFDSWTMSCDATFKDKKTSDYVAIGVWAKSGDLVYLMDQIHDKIDVVATVAAIESLLVKWKNIYSILIEDAANGPAIMQLLKNKLGNRLVARPTGGGKLVRAKAVTGYWHSGRVVVPHPKNNGPSGSCPWSSSFVSEVVKFPRTKYDDQVDQMTHYLAWLNETEQSSNYLQKMSQM